MCRSELVAAARRHRDEREVVPLRQPVTVNVNAASVQGDLATVTSRV
jgi:hypothetical protein